jgi:D-arabinitol 4-dehydrogenase
MVDRITPRPPPDLRERVRAATGRDDAAPVMGESFIQWVIEDDFCNGRPAWERVGVEMVESVAPYEEAKIRILNASHSAIAWAGTLGGLPLHPRGHRRRAHPPHRPRLRPATTSFRASCRARSTWRVTATSSLERFGNAAIRDTNQRVAMDGYSKIPGFIAPTVARAPGARRIDRRRGDAAGALPRVPRPVGTAAS